MIVPAAQQTRGTALHISTGPWIDLLPCGCERQFSHRNGPLLNAEKRTWHSACAGSKEEILYATVDMGGLETRTVKLRHGLAKSAMNCPQAHIWHMANHADEDKVFK